MNRGYLRYVELMGPLASSITLAVSVRLFAATSDLRFTSVQHSSSVQAAIYLARNISCTSPAAGSFRAR